METEPRRQWHSRRRGEGGSQRGRGEGAGRGMVRTGRAWVGERTRNGGERRGGGGRPLPPDQTRLGNCRRQQPIRA